MAIFTGNQNPLDFSASDNSMTGDVIATVDMCR